jgi:Sulfotransferase family
MSPLNTLRHVTGYSGVTPKLDLRGHTLIFTHIPKTAGTSLVRILTLVAAIKNIPSLRAQGTIYGQFHGFGKGDAWQELEQWPDSVLAQQCYISGHFPFGTHRRVPRPFFYITLLRDPVPRLVSQYRFGVQRGGWSPSTPIGELIEKGLLAENLQSRQIAGVMDRNTPCTAQTLKDAINHLQSEYTIVGVTDGFDDMLKQLITLLAWPEIIYSNQQVTEGAPSPQLVEQAKEAVTRFFAYDLELYACASELARQSLPRLFEGAPTGRQRQAQVLVAGLRVDGQEAPIMPVEYFDRELRPALAQQGIGISMA